MSWLEGDVVICVQIKIAYVFLNMILVEFIIYCSLLLCIFVLIFWENRLKGDIGRDCLISVNETDFQIHQQKGSYKYWFGYKFKVTGVRYAVRIFIMCGGIVWMNGTYPCEFYNNIKIFQMALRNMLVSNEHVEADEGYIGKAPTHVLCPKAIRCMKMTKEKKKLAQQVISRQETVNKRFKKFHCLTITWRHSIASHLSFLCNCCFDSN